jgi:hypothetical protein
LCNDSYPTDRQLPTAAQLFTKVVLTVQKLDASGLSLAFQLPGIGAKPVSLTHELRAVLLWTVFVAVLLRRDASSRCRSIIQDSASQ